MITGYSPIVYHWSVVSPSLSPDHQRFDYSVLVYFSYPIQMCARCDEFSYDRYINIRVELGFGVMALEG